MSGKNLHGVARLLLNDSNNRFCIFDVSQRGSRKNSCLVNRKLFQQGFCIQQHSTSLLHTSCGQLLLFHITCQSCHIAFGKNRFKVLLLHLVNCKANAVRTHINQCNIHDFFDTPVSFFVLCVHSLFLQYTAMGRKIQQDSCKFFKKFM